MNLYPFDLVTATALAWAAVLLGALPARQMRDEPFRRCVLLCGCGWIGVALLAPSSVLHYHILIGLACLVSWWRLSQGDGLRGKMWFYGAAGLGLSAGIVLILAVTPEAYPPGLPIWRELLILASLYLGGAVTGLAGILFVFTRREATRAGISTALVERFAGVIFPLVLVHAGVLLGDIAWAARPLRFPETALLFALTLGLEPALAWVAGSKARSPAPSGAGSALLLLAATSYGAGLLARWLTS
jgi:hypothetical protein